MYRKEFISGELQNKIKISLANLTCDKLTLIFKEAKQSYKERSEWCRFYRSGKSCWRIPKIKSDDNPKHILLTFLNGMTGRVSGDDKKSLNYFVIKMLLKLPHEIVPTDLQAKALIEETIKQLKSQLHINEDAYSVEGYEKKYSQLNPL